MNKNIKLLSTIVISAFFMLSILPSIAEETPVTECASTISENASENIIDAGTRSESTGESTVKESTTECALEYNTDLLDVVLPISVTIRIDPYELNGRGQIFSDKYKIQNMGSTDVLLTFTDMKVTFANNQDFEALAQPVDKEGKSDLKAIYLVMDFDRDDIPPVVLTDEKLEGHVSIPMPAAKKGTADTSSFSISFSGNVNESPAKSWCNGDISITLHYILEVLPAPQTTPAGAEFELEEPVLETTPVGAAFEPDDPALETTPVGAEFELDGPTSETTPAGASFELGQTKSVSQVRRCTSDEAASGILTMPELTPTGILFDVDQSELFQTGSDLSEAISGNGVAIELTPPGRVTSQIDQTSAATLISDLFDRVPENTNNLKHALKPSSKCLWTQYCC